MKVLEVVRKQYAILGISSSSNQLPFNKRILFGLLLFEYLIVSQIVYIFYVANGFLEYVECVSATTGSSIIFVCFVAIISRKTTIFKCIEDIEKLIETRFKYPKSKASFMKTNQRVERVCKIVFTVVVKIAIQGAILPKCIGSFWFYFITDLGSDSFQLPYPMWFPFDTNNPLGYLIAVILEYILCAYEFFMVSCTLAMGIGLYRLAVSATKEIQRNLHSINRKAKTKKNESKELKVLLSESIHAHGIVKRVEHDFSDVLQPIIMSLFTWSLLSISGAMLIFQVEITHHGNVMPVLINVTINGIFTLATVFIACELGQRMNDAFEDIELTIDQFDWYLFPIEIKRMLPMIIVNAQQPVSLECFGSILCTREVFKNVIHRAYSYFMVLRQLGD